MIHTSRIGLAVAITFSGILVPVAIAQDNCMHPRIISVTGTAEIKVSPDEVQLTVGIDSRDKDLVVAKTSKIH